MFVTSGKEDDVTCWEEKVPFYQTISKQNRYFFLWDLRSHKGGVHTIKDRPLELVMRYRSNLSYPAFSNSSDNSYPGTSTNNVDSPYYSGDPVGTINGMLDWMDTSIHETPTSWSAKVFSHQFLLVDGVTLFPYTLPTYVKADITPRRLQQFVNIPDGSTIHLENWKAEC